MRKNRLNISLAVSINTIEMERLLDFAKAVVAQQSCNSIFDYYKILAKYCAFMDLNKWTYRVVITDASSVYIKYNTTPIAKITYENTQA